MAEPQPKRSSSGFSRLASVEVCCVLRWLSVAELCIVGATCKSLQTEAATPFAWSALVEAGLEKPLYSFLPKPRAMFSACTLARRYLPVFFRLRGKTLEELEASHVELARFGRVVQVTHLWADGIDKLSTQQAEAVLAWPCLQNLRHATIFSANALIQPTLQRAIFRLPLTRITVHCTAVAAPFDPAALAHATQLTALTLNFSGETKVKSDALDHLQAFASAPTRLQSLKIFSHEILGREDCLAWRARLGDLPRLLGLSELRDLTLDGDFLKAMFARGLAAQVRAFLSPLSKLRSFHSTGGVHTLHAFLRAAISLAREHEQRGLPAPLPALRCILASGLAFCCLRPVRLSRSLLRRFFSCYPHMRAPVCTATFASSFASLPAEQLAESDPSASLARSTAYLREHGVGLAAVRLTIEGRDEYRCIEMRHQRSNAEEFRDLWPRQPTKSPDTVVTVEQWTAPSREEEAQQVAAEKASKAMARSERQAAAALAAAAAAAAAAATAAAPESMEAAAEGDEDENNEDNEEDAPKEVEAAPVDSDSEAEEDD